MKASIIGRCMYHESQATFWDYHDWIYANQDKLTLENLDAQAADWAKTKNIDAAKLKSCSEDKATAGEVDRSVAMGRSLAVSATPTLYINGRKIEGALDWNVLKQLLQIEIDHQTQVAKANPPADDKCCTVEIPTVGAKK